MQLSCTTSIKRAFFKMAIKLVLLCGVECWVTRKSGEAKVHVRGVCDDGCVDLRGVSRGRKSFDGLVRRQK